MSTLLDIKTRTRMVKKMVLVKKMVPKSQIVPKQEIITEQAHKSDIEIAIPENIKDIIKEYKELKDKECTALKELNDDSEYQQMKDKYEKTWFKLLEPACFATETEKADEDDEERKVVSLKSSHDTDHIFEHERVTITQNSKKKVFGFYDLWKKDPKIRLYKKVVFKPFPLKVNDGEYNAFQGFPINKGKLVPILEFHELLDSLCDYDKECMTYLKAYLADIIQNPGLHNRSHSKCIIFRGQQGCGKTSFQNLLEALIGKRYVKGTADINSVLKSEKNRFACAAVHKLVVLFEEATAEAGTSKADLLKDLITSTKIDQEIKGVNGEITHANFTRFFGFTNHAKTFKIEADDRRYMIFRSSSKNVGDMKFWNSFHDKLKNSDWVFSVLQYLNTLDISKFDYNKRPITEAYNRCKTTSIPYTIRFLADIIDTESKTQKRYTIDELFTSFDGYIKKNKFKYDMSLPSFKGEIKELINDGVGMHTVKNSCMKYYIVELEFKNYCEKKKYDIFDDLTDVPEEEIPLDHGIPKTDMAISEVQGLKIENEQLKKQIAELTKQLQDKKKTSTTITVKGKEPKGPCMIKKIEKEPEPESFNEHEDLDLATELFN